MDLAPEFERFTGQARRAIWLAYQEAQRFDHDYLASEHLLAGLLREGSPEIVAAFRQQEIEIDEILEKLEATLTSAEPAMASPVFLTPRASRTLSEAVVLARQSHAGLANPGHIMRALIADPETSVRALLDAVGFDSAAGERFLLETGDALNRDLLVQSASATSDGGRVDPSPAQLAGLLAKESPQVELQFRGFPPVVDPALAESDFQLFLTQLALALALGLTGGYIVWESIDGMAGAAVVFTLIACFRNSLLGLCAGATLGGMLAQKAQPGRGPETHIEALVPLIVIGAFLGSFVGNFWRRFCPKYLHPSITQKPPGVV